MHFEIVSALPGIYLVETMESDEIAQGIEREGKRAKARIIQVT